MEPTGTSAATTATSATSVVLSCDEPVPPRAFADTPYYEGDLIDDHFHMPQLREIREHPQAPVLDRDVSRHQVECLFRTDHVKTAFAFYGIPSDLKSSAIKTIQTIEEEAPGVIQHYLEFVSFPGYPVVPGEVETIVDDNEGLFSGYGEVSLYLPHYQNVRLDDPQMRELYAIAASHDMPVMMHLIENQRQAVRDMLATNPNTTFLFHAIEGLSWGPAFLDDGLANYPNAFHSVDITLFGDVIFTASDKQDFVTRFKANWPTTLEQKVAYWKPRIEAHPDRYLWGTDRGEAAWQYDLEVGSLLEEFSRAFIGRLDPAVQERYGHLNAEALLPAV